ncbi:hypothetical protein F4679DRAFT_555282 [Xylaria curta]|nr:hypothetical protein F4679DRAFT_555282 [Xylaria curta]
MRILTLSMRALTHLHVDYRAILTEADPHSIQQIEDEMDIDDHNVSIGDNDIIEDDDTNGEDDMGYILGGDEDDFPVVETPGRRYQEVVAETSAKRHREAVVETPAKRRRVIDETPSKRLSNDSPDLSARRQSLAGYRSLDLGDIGGASSRAHQTRGASSQPRRTILQDPREALEIGNLRIRYFFPLARTSYLDEETIRGSYWGSRIENQFNALWQRDEQDSRFEQGPRGDSDELELWKMVLIRYRKILPYLFTYGLKLGEDCYEAPQSIMLSSKASYMLQKICAHSIWGDSFDTLRLALQMAVKMSIDDHCDPLGAPPDTADVEDFLRDNLKIEEDQEEILSGVIQYRFWRLNRQDDRIRDFYKKLKKQIKSSPAKSKAEASLFILTMDVMDSVLRVLDEFRPAIYPLRPAESVEAFRDYYGQVLDSIEPKDERQLMDVKWELELQELRDEEIRNAMEIFEEDSYLYDIPHTPTDSRKHIDTVPLYHHDPSLDKDTLAALTGTWKDPKRCTLSRLDRMDARRARDLADFKGGLIEMLSHRYAAEDGANADDSSMPADLQVGDSRKNSRYKSPVQEDQVTEDAPGPSGTQSLPFREQSKTGVPATSAKILSGPSINKMSRPVRPVVNDEDWCPVFFFERRVEFVSIIAAESDEQALEV